MTSIYMNYDRARDASQRIAGFYTELRENAEQRAERNRWQRIQKSRPQHQQQMGVAMSLRSVAERQQ